MLAMIQVLAIGFMAPWLFAAGAAATSIPIIIHLLNKRKFRIVIWAAMEFLLAAQRRNARRLKFQRWMLLALRCLALLVIAAGISQFFLSGCGALGNVLGGQRVAVLVWDDSYSMGYGKPGAPSAFEQSRKLADKWLSGLSSGDKAMIVRASGTGLQLGNKPTLDHRALRAEIAAAQVTDSGTDLAGAIEQTTETFKTMQKETSARQVVMLTDMSKSSVQGAGKAEGGVDPERLKKTIEELKKVATSVRVADVGVDAQSNVAVVDIRAVRPAVVAGILNEFTITVMNGTDQAQIDLPLRVTLDGVEVAQQKLGKMEAGATKEVVVAVSLPTAGRHFLEAKLPADLLPVDDVRRLMMNVHKEVPVLLVDGSPQDNRTLGSTTYLWFAYGLSNEGKSASVFAPKVVTEIELPTTPLSQYRVVVLSDTATPGPATLEQLKKFVEEGGLLMVFPGGHTNVETMNKALGEGGAKLLPATFGQLVAVMDKDLKPSSTTFAEDFSHPVLKMFGDAYKTGLKVGFTQVQTSQYLNLGLPKDGSAEVILRYAPREGGVSDAAVVTKVVGKGRVVQFASTADSRWNLFGGKPSFLPFIHELTYFAMPREVEGLTLRLGEKINLAADQAVAGSWSGPRNQRLNVSTKVGVDGKARLESSGALTFAGMYGPSGGNTGAVVAVNADSGEADIRHLTKGAFAAATGLDATEIMQQTKELEVRGGAEDKTSGTPIGRWLILVALGLFMLETILARLFSVYK